MVRNSLPTAELDLARAAVEPPSPVDAARRHALVIFAALLGLFEGPAELACAIALVLALASGRGRGSSWVIADVGLLVWLLAGVPGLFSGEIRVGSEPSLRPLLALAYVLGRLAASEDERTLGRMGAAFAVAIGVNALYGYVQVFIGDPGLERLIVKRTRSQHLFAADGDGRMRMATGLFHNRMKLAHLGAVALGLVGLAIVDRIRAKRPRRDVIAATALALVIGGGLFLTYRRAAPAALLVSCVLLGLMLGRARLAAGLAALGGGVLALFVASGYGRERLDTASVDMGARVEIWSAARRLIGDHALFGTGHGGYAPAIRAYLPETASADLVKNAITNPHNAALYVLAETGLVGFFGFAIAVAACLAALVVAVRAGARAHGPRVTLDRLALVGLLTLGVLGAVHSVLYHAPVALMFWALLGAASAHLPPLLAPREEA